MNISVIKSTNLASKIFFKAKATVVKKEQTNTQSETPKKTSNSERFLVWAAIIALGVIAITQHSSIKNLKKNFIDLKGRAKGLKDFENSLKLTNK